MANHPIVGKLCQYKSEHRDKVLFTYALTEQEQGEVSYSLMTWENTKKITGNTCIPSWMYMKYKEKYGDINCPDPTQYHVPYVVLPTTLTEIWNPEATKIKHFLIVDSKTFIAKIGNVVAGRRTILKSLSITDDIAKTYWIDEKWIEPYAHAETYMDDLKARMLNKLRQNT
jgi:hypothetical protein